VQEKDGIPKGVRMIRDLTKSAVSFSWALSLLTLKQGVNLVTPGRQQSGGDLFAPMTQVAVGQLNESMKGFYRCGDSLQSRMVDMTFSLINPLNWFNPRTWNVVRSMEDCGQTVGGFYGHTTAGQQPSAAGQPAATVPGGTPGSTSRGAAVSDQTAAAGWGPMP
jgi:hypothetical protein